MNLYHSMIVMFIASFIFQFWIMSFVMTPTVKLVYGSVGKLYMTLAMSFFMVFVEVIMHDMQYKSFSYPLLFTFGTLTLFCLYLYRIQKFVNDDQYIKGMIEHHGMALLTSSEILKKTNDYNVTKLAKNIIQTQQDEINEMQRILKN